MRWWACAAALAVLAPPPLSAQQPARATAAELAWLAGCWRQAEAGEIVEEVWLRPAGGTMVGVSRTVQADTTRSWEHMAIRGGPAGLVLEAAPAGQPPAAFLAAQVSDSAVRFENLTHDFPQQIRYLRQGTDSLIAVVSGTVNERLRTIEFHYARVTCPAP